MFIFKLSRVLTRILTTGTPEILFEQNWIPTILINFLKDGSPDPKQRSGSPDLESNNKLVIAEQFTVKMLGNNTA